MREKFKLWLEDDRLFYGVSIILIGITSFGLGRLSVSENLNNFKTAEALVKVIEPIYFPATAVVSEQNNSQISNKNNSLSEKNENNPQAPSLINSFQSQNSQNTNTAVVVVGSKKGTKYHLPTCSGAKNIKPENLITFSSITEAERAGYQKAANCPGL